MYVERESWKRKGSYNRFLMYQNMALRHSDSQYFEQKQFTYHIWDDIIAAAWVWEQGILLMSDYCFLIWQLIILWAFGSQFPLTRQDTYHLCNLFHIHAQATFISNEHCLDGKTALLEIHFRWTVAVNTSILHIKCMHVYLYMHAQYKWFLQFWANLMLDASFILNDSET